MKLSKGLKLYLSLTLVSAIFVLVFAALATAGVTKVMKDAAFMQLVFWIALVVGGWVVSGIITYVTVKIKISMHDKGIFTLSENIDKMKENFDAKLYNKDGSSIYTPRAEHEKEVEGGERRCDSRHRSLCGKVDKLDIKITNLVASESNLAKSVSNLVGRFDQYLEDIKIPKAD